MSKFVRCRVTVSCLSYSALQASSLDSELQFIRDRVENGSRQSWSSQCGVPFRQLGDTLYSKSAA